MVVVLLILLLFQTFRGGMEASQTWNYREFEEAVDSGDVVRVEITQNQEVPTGSLKVTLNDGDVRYVNVTDVKEVQSELEQQDAITLDVKDVPKQSVWLSILPTIMIAAVLLLIFSMMNRQAGGGNNKMMNFGKSRARMITPDAKRVTFQDVAGLQEEKEELEEIVDFLKEPGKFIRSVRGFRRVLFW